MNLLLFLCPSILFSVSLSPSCSSQSGALFVSYILKTQLACPDSFELNIRRKCNQEILIRYESLTLSVSLNLVLCLSLSFLFFSIWCSLCFLYSKNTISLPRFFRTRSLKGIPEAMLEKIAKVASQEEERKGFLRKSMFSSLKDRGGEDRVYTAAKGAAFFAHNSFSRISWTRVEDEVFSEDPDALIHVQWEVLKALMILVLSVYDMEDFIRIAFEEELNAERNKFMFDLFRLHKTTNEAILAIARWEMKLDDFILLHEYDVNSLLEKNVFVQQQTTPQDLLIHKDVRVSELLIQCTMIVMKQLRPLKRNYAMHLMMELTQEKCHGITNVLLLEPWGCFDFLELHRLEPPVQFVGLDVLACQIFEAMDQLIEWKGLELHKSMKSATFPLRSGVFGNCTEEVIEVVGHAECERRSEGHRFISSHLLLLGLLRTRIGGSVLKFVQLRQALEEPVRNPRYCIYGTAQCLAGVDKIQLEHLFLAIMFLELGKNFFSLGDEIIEIIEQEDLSMDECVLKLGNLCLLEGLKCDLQKEDLSINEPILELGKLCMLEELEIDLGKDFQSNSLDNNKNAWNVGLSSKRFNVFLEGLLKLIRRQAGKTSEGSVWGFISSVSKFWEPQALKLRV